VRPRGGTIAAVSATLVLLFTGPAFAQPADAAPSAESERVRALENQVKQMREELRAIQLREGLRDAELRERERLQKEELERILMRASMPMPSGGSEPMPFGGFSLGGLPIKIGASVTLRYDYSQNSDLNDTLQGDSFANGLRYRIRLGVDLGDKHTWIVGGVRLSAAETPNPTAGFAALGDAFRPNSIGFDQWWVGVRPFADRERAQLTIGKMPNPMWRGHVGSWHSEMLWDNDVSPEGAALNVLIVKHPKITLSNLAAYYQITEIQDQRFIGRTGVTWAFLDQVKLHTKWVTAAVAYLDYENLNNGVSTPNFTPGMGASPQAATNPFLLRPGLQLTNNRINVGPRVEGFVSDAFRLLDVAAQLHIPIKAPRAGNPDFFVMADYVHNFSVPADRDGIRGTVGIRLGDYKQHFHPMNLWVTYGWVQADATLATFADSDLGAGTGYQGVQAGVNYRFIKNLAAQVLYNHFDGYPRYENTTDRLYVDLIGDF